MALHNMWGVMTFIHMLRAIFMHHTVPENVTPEQVLFHLDKIIDPVKYYRGMDGNVESLWRPKDVQFIGPGMKADGYRFDRITMFYGPDRKVTDISVG